MKEEQERRIEMREFWMRNGASAELCDKVQRSSFDPILSAFSLRTFAAVALNALDAGHGPAGFSQHTAQATEIEHWPTTNRRWNATHSESGQGASVRKAAIAIGIGVRAVRGVEIARVMKTAGFDWLFIDLEHGPTSVETAYSISVAALDAGIAPLVRVPAGELALATRCLDGGALGIVMPHVDTPEQAREMVDAFRFAPLGHRSIAGGYPQFGFAAVPVNEVVAGLNEATLVVAMLETPRAIENAEQDRRRCPESTFC